MAAMQSEHDKWTIVTMAIVACGLAILLHEGVGHGVTAWLRGDMPTELTSNHLSSLRADKWVAAGGTLVNLAVGALSLIAIPLAGARSNLRYFLWLLAAENLFPAAGYFALSGIFAFGDWEQVIAGWPHQALLRIGMSLCGVALYIFVAWRLAIAVRPFLAQHREYNVVGRLPYLASCVFSCAAGALDPLGLKLFFVSTVSAAFGGLSGMLWLDSLMPRKMPEPVLVVRRAQVAWFVFALLFAAAFIGLLGRGIELRP